MTTTAVAAPMPRTATTRTMRAISRCSGVFSVSIDRSAVPIRPSSVCAPVHCTTAMPWPLTTSVPENTHGVASPPGGPISTGPSALPDLRTGTDSPVSADSST